MMKSKIAVGAIVVLASVMTSAFAQSQTTPTIIKKTDLPLLCAKSYDPYREPVSVLRSCGDVILRLRRVTPLPGGGKAYDYGAYTQFVPPSHFNVLTASDRQLQEYALPTRQKFGSRWYAMVRHIRHFVKPAPYLVEVRAATSVVTGPIASTVASCSLPSCTENWSGYGAYHGHSYDSVGAGWYEPDFVSSSCSTTAFSQWVGIGALNGGGDLGQDGTAFGEPGLGSHQAWIETLAGSFSPPVAIKGLFATVDQKFVANASWNSSTSQYDYGMANDYTGDSWNGTSRPVTKFDLSSAEVITERPLVNGQLSDLSNYQNFQVTDAGVGWSSGGANFYNLPSSDETPIDMQYSNGNLMSFPGGLDPSSNFTMTYVRCDG